jgi:hypothetical protein
VLDAGLGSSRAASRASSTLERGLEGQETDLDRLAPMEVIEGPSALEAATAENLALKDGADTYPAPEDVVGDDSACAGNASHCQPPRVLPEVIRLKWVAQTMAPPTKFWAPLMALSWFLLVRCELIRVMALCRVIN